MVVPMKSRKKIGKTLREARLEKGVTQKELAKEAGLSRASIINIELGRVLPKYDHMVRICKRLGVSSLSLEG